MAREEAEIKELTKKLEQNPESMVFVQLADAYRRSGDLDRCVQICQQGLERHPTYTTARTILGRAFLDLGKLDEAAGEFKKIEISDPENIVAQRMLGQIYMDKGLYAEAIAKHQKVLSLDPDDTAAQEHLQEALSRAKQLPDAKAASPAAPAPAAAPQPKAAQPSSEQLGTIKVAEIYIKKGALDEAVEVLSEILATDPQNALARQKLKEVEERRGAKSGAAQAEQEAKKKAEEEAEAKKKAAEDAKRKADEDAKKKAEEETKKKAEEEAKKKAEEAAKKKAEEEAKHKAEEAARQKADEEAKRKAEEAAKQKAEAETKKKAEEEAKRKADEEAKKKAEEAAKQKAEEEAKKKNKLSSEDILSVMKSDDDELIGDAPSHAAAPKEKAAAAGMDAKLKEHADNFVKKNGIEASLIIGTDGKLLDSSMPAGSDAATLAGTSASIFSNTEKAAQRMRFGGLQQVIVTSDDGRQIIFVQLKSAVLVAVTGKNTNLGMLRIAINDLMKKA